jgi:hypothetical protein
MRVSHLKIMRDTPQWTCVVHLAPNVNIRCAQPTPHLAIFHHSHALGLWRCQCPEHAAAYGVRPRPLRPRSMSSPRPLRPRRRSIASPSTLTASPRARRRLRPRSTPSTSTASPTPLTVRFTDAPDSALRSTLSFPSPQVIHEKLVNYCRILSSSIISAAMSKYEQLVLKYDLS